MVSLTIQTYTGAGELLFSIWIVLRFVRQTARADACSANNAAATVPIMLSRFCSYSSSSGSVSEAQESLRLSQAVKQALESGSEVDGLSVIAVGVNVAPRRCWVVVDVRGRHRGVVVLSMH